VTWQAPRTVLPYNSMKPTASTATPILFEPPAALTEGRHEIWLAAGGPDGWGGCHVWVSLDDQSYDTVGQIIRGSTVGALEAPLPVIDGALHVDVTATRGIIHPGSEANADLLLTLCWVGGELVAHTDATLVGPGRYRMGGALRRGVLGTHAIEHPIGTPFARLGQATFRRPYPAHWVGATIHVKLPAFNEFQLLPQGLDEVPAHSLLLTGISADRPARELEPRKA
jgi:hypothetical protein